MIPFDTKLVKSDILPKWCTVASNTKEKLLAADIFSAKAEYKTRDYAIAISLICLSANNKKRSFFSDKVPK